MQNKSCYICEQIETTYERYLATFFELFKRNEDEFMDLLKNGKGFCLPHFGDLLSGAERYLNEKDQARLREILFPQMIQNLERITGRRGMDSRKNSTTSSKTPTGKTPKTPSSAPCRKPAAATPPTRPISRNN